ncbi:hypothetical protein H0H92_005582 [Tricholoma furcatifolium]|nr:hypothetical protein H0H92_005582 [Tricholoma furcatifolium]
MENTGRDDLARSYVSLPDPTSAVHHSQVILPIESDSPVRAGADDFPPVAVEFSHPRIRPFIPEKLPRYDRNIKVQRKAVRYTISPLTTSFDMPLPRGWTSCFHPEGALYFFNEEKRIFTDSNLYDNDTLAKVESDIAAVETHMHRHNIERSKEIDLVLDLQSEDDGANTFYYLIDHSSRSVFSFDNMEDQDFPTWEEVKGVVSPTHASMRTQFYPYVFDAEIEANYWSIELSEDLILEFRDLVIHSMGDQMISATSVVPYSVDDLQKLLLLANSLQANVGSRFTGSTCLLSAFMYEFVRQRFYNFYGQPAARMNIDQSVYGEVKNERSWLIRLLSPILFFAPQVHLRSLEEIWVDGVTRRAPWSDFISKLISDWQEFTLYSTVVLNANVAFLAIQSVDSSSHGDVRSPAQIASYTSITTSIGSIILGLLLVRQNRAQDQRVVTKVSSFLSRRHKQALGLESLAIMYSLPYALLMWG